MVVSAATQPPATYLLWKRFNFPTDKGSQDAVAVPNWVANQLNATYSTIIALMMVHFWSIVVGLIVYFYLRKHKWQPHLLHPLAPTLWNKRSDLIDSMIETFTFVNGNWRHLWVCGLLILILAAWVGQTAMGILVPPLIILGNAAPVDPTAIFVPDYSKQDESAVSARFALEVPGALRSLGSAQVANEDLRSKVSVGQTIILGKTPGSKGGEEIIQINYGYQVTGADIGLQKFPELTLTVTGSCRTEYSWFNQTDNFTVSGPNGDNPAVVDNYFWVFPGDPDRTENEETASVFDALQPVGKFRQGTSTKGMLDDSNATWSVIVSSVGRKSYSPGSDPWYATDNTNVVKPGRPALSCWEDDVWSYKDRNSSITALTNEALPGLSLSEGMQEILVERLGVPIIAELGRRLQPSALLSSTTANDQIFDAQSSSIHNDLERLVVAAYVATTNVLTDTTLYPLGSKVDNAARSETSQIKDGVADFVVWSPDVSALSIKVLIIIPTVFVGIWILAAILLYYTPVGVANALDSNNMHDELTKQFNDAKVKWTNDGAVWELRPGGNKPEEVEAKTASAQSDTNDQAGKKSGVNEEINSAPPTPGIDIDDKV